MAIYSIIKINRLLAESDNALTSDLKGEKLEELGRYLFGKLRGLTIHAQNLFNPSRSRELDLIFANDKQSSDLYFLDAYIPIECKNTKTPTASSDLNWFANKISGTNVHSGILLSLSGVSGTDSNTYAQSEIKRAFDQFKVCVLVLDRNEILSLKNTAQLAKLLLDKYHAFGMDEFQFN